MTRAQEPRALFQEFLAATVTDAAISDRLKEWEHARAEWRKQWTGRGATSAEVLFDRLTPRAASAGSDGWEHPVAQEAAELTSWRTAWRSAAPADRRQLATAFVTVLARIETEPASSREAFTELARSATTSGLPLVVVTTAVSSLDPERFVVICDTWLATLGKHAGAPAGSDVASYPELNALALNWLTAAEADAVAPAFAGRPRADRFGVFCSWVTRAAAQEGTARFDVTQKKYKDWPPMW